MDGEQLNFALRKSKLHIKTSYSDGNLSSGTLCLSCPPTVLYEHCVNNTLSNERQCHLEGPEPFVVPIDATQPSQPDKISAISTAKAAVRAQVSDSGALSSTNMRLNGAYATFLLLEIP